MNRLIGVALPVVLIFAFQASAAERETYYSDRYCNAWGGHPTTLPSGIRPDCETEFAVVEFDWAKRPKHYECIGQALIYSAQTGKLPVCALLYRNPSEREFADRVTGYIQQSGVTVRTLPAGANQ